MKLVLLGLAVAVMASVGCEREHDLNPDALHFHLAIEASNDATRLTNRFTTSGQVPNQEERDAILRLTRIALEHADMVRDIGLARMHDDMPRIFRDRFVRGLRSVASGLEARDPQLMAEGHLHLDKWADWLESHAHEIRFPSRPTALPDNR